MKKYWIAGLLFLFNVITGFTQEQTPYLNNSLIAFSIPEKDLIPESIAYDPVNEAFFIGSTRKGKIIKRDKYGQLEDFISADGSGLWMVIGIKIDAKRRVLWACSSGGDNLEGYSLKDHEDGRPSGIFKFDLDTGKLLQKYLLNQTGEVHFFNDLVIAPNGDVYATHMFEEHAIYLIQYDSDKMEAVYTSELIKYPNGIDLSDDHQKLYVAHAEGIALIDLKTGKISSLAVPEGLKISRRESIDGLYFYKNSLIAVQADIKTVHKFLLDKTGESILQAELLELNHPMMDNPTTGEIIDDHFYYIANAQFGKFDENGLLPMKKLYEVVVLKLKLDE